MFSSRLRRGAVTGYSRCAETAACSAASALTHRACDTEREAEQEDTGNRTQMPRCTQAWLHLAIARGPDIVAPMPSALGANRPLEDLRLRNLGGPVFAGSSRRGGVGYDNGFLKMMRARTRLTRMWYGCIGSVSMGRSRNWRSNVHSLVRGLLGTLYAYEENRKHCAIQVHRLGRRVEVPRKG
ncbi:hypothetical protein GY45DRAFT_158894 [Cubamyces sp. BRFM 1775]|nr:hypothetical protein GY45DRAFT_158894 [Cubamyces sp. BRFM 1775]